MRITAPLYHRNGVVRKSAAAVLQAVRSAKRVTRSQEQLDRFPPVLANSFPKSGTHLLNQLVAALPNRKEYGAFLASMTSSFRFRERTRRSTLSCIRSLVPKEIVRGHLFYDPEYDVALTESGAVHYFIYRDPRDVVVSEVYYLRHINRWHRLHAYFREFKTLGDAITCGIRGMKNAVVDYPNIADRFDRYIGWLDSPSICLLRYEDIVGPEREVELARVAQYYADHVPDSAVDGNLEPLIDAMKTKISPKSSHTYRKGKSGGWRDEFTAEHCQMFDEVAGDLLIRLGYEADHSWADSEVEATTAESESEACRK